MAICRPMAPVLEIGQRQRIGGRGVGMIDALYYRPRPGGGTRGHDGRVFCSRIERVDGDAVIGLGFEALECFAFQRRYDKGAPARIVNGGEGRRKRQGSGGRGVGLAQGTLADWSLLIA